MGSLGLDVPGYVPPWYGGGGIGGRVIEPNDGISGSYGSYDPGPATQQPQTMAQALNPPTTQPVVAVDDSKLNIQIDQQTLLIGAAIVVGLFIFAAK